MKKHMVLVLGLFFSVTLFAGDNDSTPITIGERLTVHSKILNEDRQVLISFPAGYDQNQQKFPVMYLLDGDAHFHHTTGIIQFLSSNNQMPQMLVVALPNTQRTRDLTPPAPNDTTGRFQNAGGAETFLKFITGELMPYVEERYRTQPYKILVGHSFGGLFVVNSFLINPDAFDAYIAISPSLWWDNQRLVTDAEPFLGKNPDLNKFLYLTMGNEGGNMLPSAQAFADVLKKYTGESLEWEFKHMADETHGSIPHRTTYDALEKLFKDWQLPQDIFANGFLTDFDGHYKNLSKKFGYPIKTPEFVVNALGYRLINANRYDEAIAALKRNVEEYPESPNVYDSLGDAYDANGQFDLAKQNYEIAYNKATEVKHRNTQIYKNNFERLKKKLASK